MHSLLDRRSALLLLGGGMTAACARQSPALDGALRRYGASAAAVALVKRGESPELLTAGEPGDSNVFEVASLSKPVFAYAVLAMAARKILDLDAPLSDLAPPPYIHRQQRTVDTFEDARVVDLTPRLILAHRSGLPNWSRQQPLAFDRAPGGAWGYSGEAYVLLQQVIERRLGLSLETLSRREVFTPLRMSSSSFNPAGHPRRATGHDHQGTAVPSSLSLPSAATSLLSTVDDMSRFAQRLLASVDDGRLLEPMFTRNVEVDSSRGLWWGAGMGLAKSGHFFHWGANPGFRALLVGSRPMGKAVVVLTASENGMGLAADVVRHQFGELPLLSFPLMYPPD